MVAAWRRASSGIRTSNCGVSAHTSKARPRSPSSAGVSVYRVVAQQVGVGVSMHKMAHTDDRFVTPLPDQRFCRVRLPKGNRCDDARRCGLRRAACSRCRQRCPRPGREQRGQPRQRLARRRHRRAGMQAATCASHVFTDRGPRGVPLVGVAVDDRGHDLSVPAPCRVSPKRTRCRDGSLLFAGAPS